MDQSQQLARIGQTTHPSIECSIRKAIAEARQNKGKDQNNIWRVRANDTISGKMTARADYRDSTLTEFEVKIVVQKGGGNVADERGQEDERDDGVADGVVFLKLEGFNTCGHSSEGSLT